MKGHKTSSLGTRYLKSRGFYYPIILAMRGHILNYLRLWFLNYDNVFYGAFYNISPIKDWHITALLKDGAAVYWFSS